MIASPGDVQEERDAIRRMLIDWNDLNSASQKVVLLPAGWETHSSPDLSGRAQDLINDRILDKCDLLVGVFWTRLGTPTGEHVSGTVEEIERHVNAGRPAMIYFSTRPVVPGSYDEDQFSGVVEFKKWCQSKGITNDFESLDDFRTKFSRQLQIILRDNVHLNSLTNKKEPISSIDSAQYKTVRISDLALDMLMNAVQDKHGMISIGRFIGGSSFQAGAKSYDVSNGQREIARHQAAVEELEGYGLIEAVGYKRELFRVTNEGYEAIERLEKA